MLFPAVSFLIVLASMPLFIRLAKVFKLYDVPDKFRKTHMRNIPFTGGFSIIVGCAITIGLLLFTSADTFFAYQSKRDFNLYLYFAEASFIIIVLGVIDDLRDLSYTTKFLYQFLAAFLVLMGAISSQILPLPAIGSESNVLLNSGLALVSILWFVGMTNAINLIDGMDGLAGGTTLISATALGILALIWGNQTLPSVLFISAGALLAFLFYNTHPARVFMGNTGSMTLGFAIAVCAWVLVYTGPAKSTTTFVPLVILGLPVTDTVLAFTRRLIKGKNPFSGDMFHIHHMLKYRYGLSPRWTVFILYGMSLVFGASGLLVAILPELYGWILISLLFAGLIFFLHRLGYTHLLKSDKQTPQHFYATHQGNGKAYTRVNGNGVAKGSKLDQIDKKH